MACFDAISHVQLKSDHPQRYESRSQMGPVCNQDGINLVSHVMKCSELTRLL